MPDLPEGAVEAAAKAFTDELNPHLGGEAWLDEVSALVECGMPEALQTAAPAIEEKARKQERERLREELLSDEHIKKMRQRFGHPSDPHYAERARVFIDAALDALEDSDAPASTDRNSPVWARMSGSCAVNRHDQCAGRGKDGGPCTCSCHGDSDAS
jgi:hypothetical protein